MQSTLLQKIIASNSLIEKIYRNYRTWKKRKQYRNLSNEEIFTRIYLTNTWGKSNESKTGLYSGNGSYGEPAEKYVAMISDFINEHSISSLTDIGCGDFSIGKKITDKNTSLQYNGCDVVEHLIQQHRNAFISNRIKFFKLDAAKEQLPAADLITIREVLQHLNNNDIKQILAKCKKFKYVMITENLFLESFVKKYNKDKPSGPDIRLAVNSGVYLNKPPFNIKCTEILSSRSDAFGKEAYLKTFLIENEEAL